ncbi:MAG: hypothetical protein GY869_20985, partial [Planctomycetes bacterium]|nr:hypothetical protein [Planctomycetota bacterium]
IYLSADGSLSSAVLLGSVSNTDVLGSGVQTPMSFDATVPALVDGNYYVIVISDVDDDVFERDGEDNNVGVSDNPIVVRHSDLTVNSVAVMGGGAVLSGSEITVEWEVGNASSGTAGGEWVDRLYLSGDQSKSGDDVYLGELVHSGILEGGQTYPGSLVVELPDGIEGQYFVVVVTDAANQINELSDEGNNVGASEAQAVDLAPYADLRVYDVDGQELLIGDPADITVSWKVINDGTGSGGIDKWVDRVVLSRDGVLGNYDDREIGRFEHDGLMPEGTEYSRTEIMTLPPALEGRFTLFVETDATDMVYEHLDVGANVDEADHPVDVTPIPYADLLVDVVAVDGAGESGGLLQVSWTVSNQGIGVTNKSSWSDQVWLARDEAGTGRINLTSFSHIGSLAVGDDYTRVVDVTLPSYADGRYYVFVTTGGPYEFIYTDNNSRHSGEVEVTYIPPPPIDLTVLVVDGPTAATDGQELDMSWQVKNNGPNDIDGAWYDTLYLAPNG